jgi:hypothetical protein
LKGEAVSGPWKLVWEVPAEASEGNLNQLFNAARNDELWSEDFIPVQGQTIDIQHEEVPFANEEEIVPVLAGLTDQSRTRLNPRTVQIYGGGLQSMNVDYVTPIQEILKFKNNADFTMKSTKFDLTFIVMPSVGKLPSVRNSAGISFTTAAPLEQCHSVQIHAKWAKIGIHGDLCEKPPNTAAHS